MQPSLDTIGAEPREGNGILRNAVSRTSRFGVALLGAIAFSGWVPSALAAKRPPVVPPWWLHQAICVHEGEGAWNSETGNGFHGGLQMDSGFEWAYGAWAVRRWGHAGYWPIRVQLQVAYQGWRSRGWYPWPNTARRCGLL